MPVIKHEAFFRRHPVFTGEELAAHLAANGDAGNRTQESLLAYHTRAGRLLRVRRGLFAVIPPGADGDTYPVDPYLVAAKLTRDSVLSHHTALEFHGRAYSVWQQVTYSASRPVEQAGIPFPHLPEAPGSRRRCAASQRSISRCWTSERAGVPVRVASLERTLVDVSGSPASIRGLGGGMALVGVGGVLRPGPDCGVHAAAGQFATTASKVGFFLEQHCDESLMVEERHLHPLREMRPRQPHYLDRNRRGPGSLGRRLEPGDSGGSG